FKEWKDKLGVWAFGAGLLIFALLAAAGWPGAKDHQDLVAGVILALYFPAMGLLLGASAFEAEFRNDAWTYLLSRPVSKRGVWIVKYLSLLSLLAALWLIFAGFMGAVPGLQAVVQGLRLPVAFRAEISFLPWSLLLSLFFFTAGFSLSFLSRKGSTVLFAALLAGLALAFVAYQEATVVLGFLRDEWFDEAKWLHAFRWGLVFMGAALAAASVLAFGRADFSQPRKKAAAFVKHAVPLLVAAVLVTAAWTVLLPRTGEGYISLNRGAGGEAYIDVFPAGLHVYEPARDKIHRIAPSGFLNWFAGLSFNAGGKILFSEFERGKSRHGAMNLWIMNADGSEKRQLLGSGLAPGDPRSGLSSYSQILSADGGRIAFLDEDALQKPVKGRSPLWSMNADGSGLMNHSLNSAVFENEKGYFVILLQWTAGREGLLISQISRSSAMPSRLWLADLKDGTSRVLLEYPGAGGAAALSPDGRSLAVPMTTMDGALPHLAMALVDLASLEIRKIDVEGERSAHRLCWSPDGGRLAFFARKNTPKGSGAYVLTIVSVPDGKTLALKEMTAEKSAGQFYVIDWLKDGARLVLDDPRGDRCLKILGPDLNEEKRIPFPDAIRSPFDMMVSDDKVLVADGLAYKLWRLDIKKGSWKKLY
ncbi:MAG: ABC transporter permease, partial [Acidobacteriota bacterium]